MNCTLIKRGQAADGGLCRELASEFDLHYKIAEHLVSAGIDSAEKMRRFFYPDAANFYDPYLLSGMKEAAERIKSAIDGGETVAVFGDYDADGICSAVMLTKFLTDSGVNVYPHIPHRLNEGYGLSVEAIEKIAGEICPDLIITCDCGISCAAEVSYAMDLGIDVIVTDHHEPPEALPECITVNPKISGQKYPFSQLCGAGVVFKLLHALCGLERACGYLDLVCIATVADLVPLTDENRLIVQLGLKSLENTRNTGLKTMLKKLGITEPSAGDIAFKLAPRINAAGRMGDAYRACELMLSASPAECAAIADELEEDNLSRKELCDRLYIQAEQLLVKEAPGDSRCIVLLGDDWEKGVLGILAARISSDFNRPAFLLSGKEGSLKGTARGIYGVSVYDALAACAPLLTEFGGHSQAAGFTVERENAAAFKEALCRHFAENYPPETFIPFANYDFEVEEDELDESLMRSVERLEPFGNSNLRPVIKLNGTLESAEVMRTSPLHASLETAGKNRILAFHAAGQVDLIRCVQSPYLLIEASLNSFKGKESLRLVLKKLVYGGLSEPPAARLERDYFSQFLYFGKPAPENGAEECGIGELIAAAEKRFGTVFYVNKYATYRALLNAAPALAEVPHDLYAPADPNNTSRIVLGGRLDFNLSLFDRVFVVDNPLTDGFIRQISGKFNGKISVLHKPLTDCPPLTAMPDMGREAFKTAYATLAAAADTDYGSEEAFFETAAGSNAVQLLCAYLVFCELDIIKVPENGFKIILNKGVRSSLEESPLYRHLAALQNPERAG